MRPLNVMSAAMRCIAAALLLAMLGAPGIAQTPTAPGKSRDKQAAMLLTALRQTPTWTGCSPRLEKSAR